MNPTQEFLIFHVVTSHQTSMKTNIFSFTENSKLVYAMKFIKSSKKLTRNNLSTNPKVNKKVNDSGQFLKGKMNFKKKHGIFMELS